MTLEGEITSWFCKKNHIKRESLDKYHRYAIATTLKYTQEQVKNIAYEPVLADEAQRSEQLLCPDCKSDQIYRHVKGATLHCAQCKCNWAE